MTSSLLALVVLAGTSFSNAATYSQTASLSGQSFLDAFSWQAISDPTHGRVEYVSELTARADKLYSVSRDTVILRADHTTVLNSSEPGRKSFRLQSHDKYETHVAIFDIGHMPEGCGTWPAELGSDWPNHGEIDIIEGVNDQTPNLSTLHTSAGCTMPSGPRHMTGTSATTDCDAYDNENAGCGVRMAETNSFGPCFNEIGGGWYAIERSATYIAIYFWGRNSENVPFEVKCPGSTVDTSTWGTPAAYFPDTDCNFSTHFGPMNIIINLTFCGDWAGSVYASSGCPSNCVDYVNNNPSAFSNAYFEFNGLHIYKPCKSEN